MTDFVLKERPGLDAIQIYTAAPRTRGIFLDTNENPYPLAGDPNRARLSESVRDLLQGLSFNRYPETDAYSFRRELARSVALDAEEVRVGNGSSELLAAACRAFGGAQSKIAYIYPSFSMYKTYAALADSPGLAFPLNADFTLDTERLSDFLRRQRPEVLLLCNPNNPTGTLYPAAALAGVIKAADCLVLLDEAYMEFAPAGCSLLDRLKEFDNLAVFRTFSKAYGLAGLRVGYVASGNRKIIQALGKVLLPYNVNALSLSVARLIYEQRGCYGGLVGAVVTERAKLSAALSGLGLTVYPSAANFVFFTCARQEQTAALAAYLAQNGIFLRDFSRQPDLTGLRLTVGTPEENAAVTRAIKNFLAG